MSEKFLRVYRKLDVQEIKSHLLIYGALSGSCAGCQQMDVKIDSVSCPACGTEFKYMAFRNIKEHLPKVQKLNETRPQLVFVDYDDFKRTLGALTAEEFLK